MTNKFFERHVFFCTNQRPDGHEKGCCASKKSVLLRAYMKKKTKEIVTDKKIRINALKITLFMYNLKQLILNSYGIPNKS